MTSRSEKRAEARRLEEAQNRGFVYLIYSENGYYKIGITKAVAKRFDILNASIPMQIELLHSFECSNYQTAEYFLHDKYSQKRFKYEWFKLDAEDVEWFKSLQDDDPRIQQGVRSFTKKWAEGVAEGLMNALIKNKRKLR